MQAGHCGERILIWVLPDGLFAQEESCYLGDRRTT
jgi:hypothetical protein